MTVTIEIVLYSTRARLKLENSVKIETHLYLSEMKYILNHFINMFFKVTFLIKH